MNVFQRKPGGNYYVRTEVRGEKVFQSLKTTRKAVAMDRAKAIVGKMREGQFAAVKAVRSKSEAPTFGELVEAYRAAALSRGLKPKFIPGNIACLRRVVGMEEAAFKTARLHLDEKTLADYVDRSRPAEHTPEGLLRWRRSARATIRKARTLFAAWALQEYRRKGFALPDLKAFLKAELVPGKGVAKKYTRPPQEQVDAVKAGARVLREEGSPLYTVFLLTYSLALRAEEAAFARREWLRNGPEGWELTVPVDELYMPKGMRERGIPVHPDVAADLVAAADAVGSGYFLPGDVSGARYNLVQREFSAWMRGLGWTRPRCAHELRALQGCRWFTEQGPAVAQKLLGHASVATTCAHYAEYSQAVTALTPDW
jgi:integrase